MPVANLSIIVKMSGGSLPPNSRAGDVEIYDSGRLVIFETDTDIVERQLPREKVVDILQFARQSGFFQLSNILHDTGNPMSVPDVTISIVDMGGSATVTMTNYQRLRGEMRKEPFDAVYKMITDTAWDSYTNGTAPVAETLQPNSQSTPQQSAAIMQPQAIPSNPMPNLPFSSQSAQQAPPLDLPSLDDLLKSSNLDFGAPVPQANNGMSLPPLANSGPPPGTSKPQGLPPLARPQGAPTSTNSYSLPPLGNFQNTGPQRPPTQGQPPIQQKPQPAPAPKPQSSSPQATVVQQAQPPARQQPPAQVQNQPKIQLPPQPQPSVQSSRGQVKDQNQPNPGDLPQNRQDSRQQTERVPKQEFTPRQEQPLRVDKQAEPRGPRPEPVPVPAQVKPPEVVTIDIPVQTQERPRTEQKQLVNQPQNLTKANVQVDQNAARLQMKRPPVGWEHTQELVGRLEESFKGKLLTFYIAPGHEVTMDDMRNLYTHLRKAGSKKTLYFMPFIPSGQMPVVWRMATLIREFCQELVIVIPDAASIYTTMLALSADTILMNPLGYLSPIETKFSHPALETSNAFALNEVLQAAQMTSYTFSAPKTKTASSPLEVTTPSSIHPLAVTAAQRQLALTQLLCGNLLRLSKKGPKADIEITRIVQQLTGAYLSSDYPITFNEVKDLGLQVRETTEEMNDLLWDLVRNYSYISQPVVAVRDDFKSVEQQAVLIESEGRRTLFYKEVHEDMKNDRIFEEHNRWREVTQQISITQNGKEHSELIWKELEISGNNE